MNVVVEKVILYENMALLALIGSYILIVVGVLICVDTFIPRSVDVPILNSLIAFAVGVLLIIAGCFLRAKWRHKKSNSNYKKDNPNHSKGGVGGN